MRRGGRSPTRPGTPIPRDGAGRHRTASPRSGDHWTTLGSLEAPHRGTEDGAMPHERIPERPSTRRYTPVGKEQAVRLVRTLRSELGTERSGDVLGAEPGEAVPVLDDAGGYVRVGEQRQELAASAVAGGTDLGHHLVDGVPVGRGPRGDAGHLAIQVGLLVRRRDPGVGHRPATTVWLGAVQLPDHDEPAHPLRRVVGFCVDGAPGQVTPAVPGRPCGLRSRRPAPSARRPPRSRREPGGG
jgi:hypothetical protein